MGARRSTRQPSIEQLAGLVLQLRLVGEHQGGKTIHIVTLSAAKQFVDRDTEGLALDVVQGDVNRRDGGRQDAPTFKVLAAIEILPDSTDATRISADEQVTKVVNGTDHGQLTSAEA